MSERRVFSLPDYDLIIDDTVIDSKDICSVRLIRVSENLPVKGLISSELVISLHTDELFTPNSAVLLSINGVGRLQPHFISRIRRRGSLVTIHAFDRLRMLEAPFDDSSITGSEPFDPSYIIGKAAAQLGFKGVLNLPSCCPPFYYSDIHRKKVKDILELAAQSCAGAWYCSKDENLVMAQFMGENYEMAVDVNGSSPIYIHSRKGPVTAVSVMNTSSGKIYTAGTDPKNILRLSGELFTQAQAEDILSRIKDKTYRSFYCAHISTYGIPEGLTAFYRQEDSKYFYSNRYEVHFTGSGYFVKAQPDDICEDEWEYTDILSYDLRKRISAGREYGSTVINEYGGIGILSDTPCDDTRERTRYYFSEARDAVTAFDGAILDKTMPDSVESVSKTEKRIRYGSSVYTLSFAVDENGVKTNISLSREDG